MARHGENIRKRTDGRWEGRYKVFDEGTGKSVYRSVYGRDYGETKEKLSRAKLELACQGMAKQPGERAGGGGKSTGGSPGVVLFSQAAGGWLAELSGRRKYSTYIKYDTVYRTHLAGIVGSCRLSAGTARELGERIFDHLCRAGLSESMGKSVVCVANQILSFANRRYLTGLPLLERAPSKMRKRSLETFSRAEQAALLDCIYGRLDSSRTAVLLCLHAGLRLGELCALRWADIDLQDKTLTVNRTVQRVAAPDQRRSTVLLETDPKSESSRRTIPLTEELLGLLSRLKGEKPYVFGGERPLEPRTMQYRFKKLLEEAGIQGRSFHALRHTFATNCVENGMDVKALSELLGHSDVKITLNHYVHPTMESKRRQIGALSEFYGRICGRAA